MAVLLVTTQIINQVLETVVPFYLFKFRAKQIKKRSPENTDKTLELDMIEATRDEYEVNMLQHKQLNKFNEKC